MNNYHFNDIEAKWQQFWAKNETFKAVNHSEKPKYYVLDMFPYPSGAGLHVGHPLGYIASDVYARFKRHQGYNVLHPMGYDSFGLPAEQYAIQTGQHPANTTQVNIEGGVDKQGNKIPGYRKQMDTIGFSFDWSREVRTSDPSYYKWTQWIFIQLFDSWYDHDTKKARPVSELVTIFSSEGNTSVHAACDDNVIVFSSETWNGFSEAEKEQILLQYRLTYLAETEVNWCPALGTVLANDEVVNGVSERGGHPVIRKKMKQWSMRITAYSQRLLDGLDTIDWPQPLKDSQTNWIGRSEGATVTFNVLPPAPSSGGGVAGDGQKHPNSFLPTGEGQGDDKEKAHPTVISSERGAGYRLTGDTQIIGTLLARAKEMRKNPTLAEKKLWEVLRNKQLGVKFRRQHPIFKYIVDFVCLEKHLVIEVDGKIHDYQIDEDELRTLTLHEKKGFNVLRFTNEEVQDNIENVLKRIKETLDSLPTGEGQGGDTISVFTTRPDTIFGVSFMVLAPEHELVSQLTTSDQKAEIQAYVEATAKRSERERMADVKTISGVFTGAYAEHPFTKKAIPIWIGDYVLAGYGTGAVMSVPCGDQRDYDFAKHFNIDIPNIFEGVDISEAAYADKDNTKIANSDFLNGLNYKKATKTAIYKLEEIGAGTGKINYRLRDAVFSRQRYWGEPFPVYYKNGLPQMIDAEHLPLTLPEIDEYLPTEDGQPPLGRAEVWAWDTSSNQVVANSEINNETVFPLELNTMPGWAGSSCYMFRYMDPSNTEALASEDAMQYWENVDLYLGGSEHATGHLLYSRFWVKTLYDLGYLKVEEPFKKLINQGMILGTVALYPYFDFKIRIGLNTQEYPNFDSSKAQVTEIEVNANIFIKREDLIRADILDGIFLQTPVIDRVRLGNEMRELFKYYLKYEDARNEDIDVSILSESYNTDPKKIPFDSIDPISKEIDIEKVRKNAMFPFAVQLTDEPVMALTELGKMSKSWLNVVSPDFICEKYGADSLRLYEMFLGPLEQSKPWNTDGISGVHNFLKKLWKLYHTGANGDFMVSDTEASKDSMKTLHKTIKKVAEDIENFSFNTSVSTFMIAVNELGAQKCTSKEVLEPLLILLSPYAPHIAEELWSKLGHSESIAYAAFPKFEEKYLVESSKNYPISFNGKMRFTMELPLDMSKDAIEAAVMAHEKTQFYLEGRTPKKVIIVPGKIVNIVG